MMSGGLYLVCWIPQPRMLGLPDELARSIASETQGATYDDRFRYTSPAGKH